MSEGWKLMTCPQCGKDTLMFYLSYCAECTEKLQVDEDMGKSVGGGE